MVPFESLCKVSYSHSIANIAVSTQYADRQSPSHYGIGCAYA